ncbi:MAG: hypothetical protein CMD96_02940 [Gammaproteobacteria bacterium]|nr:hypothetical protein [Gammaproteobacteria bacterium]
MNMKDSFSFPVLEHPAPGCDTNKALELATDWMETDESSKITPLVSERDQNFLISTKDEKTILKISNHKEEKGVLDFQNEALLHLEGSTNLNLPKVKKSINGEHLVLKMVGDEECFVRMVSFVDGVPLDDIELNNTNLKPLHTSMGDFLAKLGKGLHGFSHPHQGHQLLWDIAQTENLFSLLDRIEDKQKRKMIEAALVYYQKNSKNLLSKQRKQVIHNDMNPDNVLVAKEDPCTVAGMIDFGDMLYAPLINDLSIACAYEAIRTESLFEGSKHLLLGYHNENKLTESEIRLLPMLAYNRLAMTLIISEWRAAEHPGNKEYILGNIGHTWMVFGNIVPEEIETTGEQLGRFVSANMKT